MSELDNSADELDEQVAPVVEASEGGEQAREPVASEETQEEVSYVTVEQFEEWKQGSPSRSDETLRRAKQSGADRYKAIQEEVDKAKALFEGSMGAKVSPEQERMMRQKVEADMNAAELPQESPSANGQGASSEDAGAGVSVDGLISAAFEVGGAEVLPSDPEGKAIEAALKNPKMTPAGLQAVSIQASMAKAQRLKGSKEKSRLQQPTGGGGNRVDLNSIKNITDSDKLYDVAAKGL